MTSGNSLSTAGLTKLAAMMIVGVIIIAAVLAPMLNDLTRETIVEDYNNPDDASWIRMNYGTENIDTEYSVAGDTLTIGDQSGAAQDMILYADEKVCVMYSDGFTIVNGYSDPATVVKADTVHITNADGTLTISDGTDIIIQTSSPAWSYYPDKEGTYSYFSADVEGVKVKDGDNRAFAGNFAGVYAYNNTVVAPNNLGDLGFSLNAVVEDDVITSVIWDLDGSAVVPPYSVPANEGDWTYSITNGYASITGYNGTNATNLVIPSKINDGTRDYNVLWIGGTSSTSDPIITDAQISDAGATLYIENGPNQITSKAFLDVTKIKGAVYLPPSITSVAGSNSDSYSFRHFGQSDTLIIGGNVSAGGLVFAGSTFKNMIVLGNISSSYSGYSSNIKEVLNLGSGTITTTSYGLQADEVRDDIPASGYIAPLSNTKVVVKEGAAYDILLMMPVLLVIALLIPIADYFVGDNIRSRVR